MNSKLTTISNYIFKGSLLLVTLAATIYSLMMLFNDKPAYNAFRQAHISDGKQYFVDDNFKLYEASNLPKNAIILISNNQTVSFN